MKQAITFDITPKGQERPRFTTKNGGRFAYKSEKARDYESELARQYKAQGGRFFTGAIVLEVVFSIPIPASWSKKKRLQALNGELEPMGRPDLDNYVKGLLDALNGTAYKDDACVVGLVAVKRYAEQGAIHTIFTTDDED